MSIASLNQVPEYLAVSHVWGQVPHAWTSGVIRRSRTFGIIIDGVRVVVSRNLWAALADIRSRPSPTWVWADAICINQADADEKAWQVGLMSRIYTQAFETVIWLGRGDGRICTAIDFLGQSTRHGFTEASERLRCGSYEGNQEAVADAAPWTSLKTILDHPWWGRRWVIQEAFLSKNPLVTCGPAVSLDKFAELAAWHEAYVSKTPDAHPVIKKLFQSCPFYPLLKQWKTYRKEEHVYRAPLPRWLALARDFEQSLARDVVFGLLPLSSAHDQLKVRPDYRSPDDVVFQCLFVHLIEAYGFLSLQVRLPCHPQQCLLPSWCGVGNSVGSGVTVAPINTGRDQPVFKAGGDSKRDVHFAFDDTLSRVRSAELEQLKPLLGRGIHLLVRGLEFDSVAIAIPTGICSNYSTEIRLGSLEQRLRAAVGGWQRRLSGVHPSPYNDNDGRLQAACQTLLGGRTEDVAIHELVDRFRAWMGRDRRLGAASRATAKKNQDVDTGQHASWAATDAFYAKIRARCLNRALIITAAGYLGLGPRECEVGDVVAVFHGCRVPCVLRKGESSDYHAMLGEAYIHDIMHGEATRMGQGKGICEFAIK